MKSIRAFVAVKLPEEVAAALGETCDSLQAMLPPRAIRWVQPGLMHLTLRFLGDTDVARLPAVSAVMDSVTAAYAPFAMRLTELGCFPNRRRPRVIWAGLGGDDGQVVRLQHALDLALEPLGWKPEAKPFHPHLTLGRVKGDAQAVSGLPWGMDLAPLGVPVGALHLIESQLRPSGPIYTVRHSSALGG